MPVTRGCIGNNVPPPAGERTQPLYGQLGRVLIFTEALAKEEVRCLGCVCCAVLVITLCIPCCVVFVL